MRIENARYMKERHMDDDGNLKDVVAYIACTVDGVPNVSVPMDEENTHYNEILRQVKEDGLTVADAE